MWCAYVVVIESIPVKKNTYLLHWASFRMLFFLFISKRNLYFISCFDLVINEIDKLNCWRCIADRVRVKLTT